MAIYTVTLNTAIDVVISEKDYLEKNKKKAVNIPAGKGINVSRALKSAGIASTAIALVGIKDVKLFNRIKDDKINAIFLTVKGATRKNTTITDTSDGLEHHKKSTGFTASEEDLTRVYNILLENVFEGDWVIFSGSLPKGMPSDAYKRLIMLCKMKGAYTLLDSSGEALMLGLQASPFALKPNEEELEEITGMIPENDAETEKIVKKISSLYDIPIILATFGEKGGVLYSFENDKMYKNFEPDKDLKVVSTVGSGDCCVAGLVVSLLEHCKCEECLKRAMDYAHANIHTPIPGVFYSET
jgi:1-phosphofructokinase family hexose kinase